MCGTCLGVEYFGMFMDVHGYLCVRYRRCVIHQQKNGTNGWNKLVEFNLISEDPNFSNPEIINAYNALLDSEACHSL